MPGRLRAVTAATVVSANLPPAGLVEAGLARGQAEASGGASLPQRVEGYFPVEVGEGLGDLDPFHLHYLRPELVGVRVAEMVGVPVD